MYFSYHCYKHSCTLLLAAINVFLTSMITVMGPTPPGTGVMYEATSFTASKSTSPTKREPEALVASVRQWKLKDIVKIIHAKERINGILMSI